MTNNGQLAIKEQTKTVGMALEKMKAQFQQVLPRHITPERLIRVALVAVQNTPKLLECDRNSLYLAILRSAQLGLEPDGVLGQAYLIPYGKQVQFIPGYRGLIDLARRSGEVSNIIAKEVCERDVFEVDYSLEMPFSHKPLLNGDRGEITHFWALAKFKDGGFHWDYMTRQEVEDIRDGSSGYQSAKRFAKNGVINSPWVNHFAEMGKKTVIRRIAKYLPMSVQKAAEFDRLQEEGRRVEFDEHGEIEITGNEEGIIEGEATLEGGDETEQPKGKLENFAGEGEASAEPEAKREPTLEELDAMDAAEAAASAEADDYDAPDFIKRAAGAK